MTTYVRPLTDISGKHVAAPDGAGALGAERWPMLGIMGSEIPYDSEPQMPDNMQPQDVPGSAVAEESACDHVPAPSLQQTVVVQASGPSTAAGSGLVDGSAPTGTGQWPALHFMCSSEFATEDQNLLANVQQGTQHVGIVGAAVDALHVVDAAPLSTTAVTPPAAAGSLALVVLPAAKPGGQNSTGAAPEQPRMQHHAVCAWDVEMADLDDLLQDQTEVQQHLQHEQQESRHLLQPQGDLAAGSGQPTQAQQQQRVQPAKQLPQHLSQQLGAPAAAPAAQVGRTGTGTSAYDDWADDDDFDQLIEEHQEFCNQLPLPPDPLHRPELEPELSICSPPRKGRRPQAAAAAAAVGAGDSVADLDAELDELDSMQQAHEAAAACSRKRQRTAHGANPAAPSAAGINQSVAGGLGGDFDFGDELDELFEEAGDAVDDLAGHLEEPTTTVLKPATLESLGAGTAGRTVAEAVAALEAAALPPHLLASSVKGCSITVTCSSGQRVYCQLAAARLADAEDSSGAAGRHGVHNAAGLLAEPIDELFDKLAERRRLELAAECAAAEALAQEVETLVNQGPQDDQAPAEAAGVANAAAAPDPQQAAHHTLDSQPQQSAPRQLWVDKYAPKSFLQLLSEPRTNREIATWMAKWKQPQSGQQQAAPQHQQQKQQQHAAGNSRFSGGDKRQQQGGRGYGRGSGAGRGSGGGGNFATGFDAARYQAAQAARAAAKMLLVVGPPGTGKTTLAHVLAAHCGFRVVEINASDERTASTLTRRIADAAQMTHVLDGTKHPPCIVLDELDGASGGTEGHSAIAALVRMVTGEAAAGKQRKRGAKPGSNSSSQRRGGLGVPIIATANDAYAPCLRPLRDVAAIYHFKPPGPDRLMSRLAAIAAAERMSMGKQALSALVERSGCDIRTAINTMQLLARQASDSKVRFSRPSQPSSQRSRRVTVTASSVWSSAALGLKDVSRTPLGVMQDLLTAGTNKAMTLRLHQLSVATTAARRDGNNIRAAAIAGATAAARLQLQEHYNMLLDLGEHELVMSGVHEHLPSVVGLDVDLVSTAAAAAALADADRLMAGGATTSSGGRGMFQYVPACLLAATKLAKREGGGLGANDLGWPRAQAECGRVGASSRALIRAWRASAPASSAAALSSGAAAVLDFAPALSAISRPAGIKAVSRQLLSTQQAALLDHVVNVLVSYGLNYSFPAEDSDHQVSPSYAAAPGRQMPRPAPISPAIDTLHVYSTLKQLCGISPGGGAGGSCWDSRVMPLVLRQMMAQMISTANIKRLARHAGELSSPTAVGQTPGRVKSRTQQQQQQPKGPAKALDHRAAAKAAVLPGGKPKAAGTWLDALKARTAPKRKATGPAAHPQVSKRPTSELGGTAPHEAQESGSHADLAVNSVLYKYNEGYTNAVKRPMKVSEWLQ